MPNRSCDCTSITTCPLSLHLQAPCVPESMGVEAYNTCHNTPHTSTSHTRHPRHPPVLLSGKRALP
jgi:hypothetical protein